MESVLESRSAYKINVHDAAKLKKKNKCVLRERNRIPVFP